MKKHGLTRLLVLVICFLLGTMVAFAEEETEEVTLYQSGEQAYLLLPEGSTAETISSLWQGQDIAIFDAAYMPQQTDAPFQTGSMLQILSGEIAKEIYEIVIIGDTNRDGKVSTADARQVLRTSVQLEGLSKQALLAADIDKDGNLLTYDARMILRMALGLSVQSKEEYDSSVQQSEEESRSIAASIEASIEASLEQSRLDAMRFDPVLKQSNTVDMRYFDDTVFIGDSVSMMLSYHNNRYESLGNAKFLVRGSMSARNALWPVSSSSYHPRVNGNKVRVEDGVAMLGAKKVYIMLGMNEISMGVDAAVQNLTTLCDLIVQKSPDVTMIVESVTPMAQGSTSTSSRLNNTTISQFNQKMQAVCEQKRWYYLDVASVLKDANGYLKRAYCSDYPSMGLHLTYDAAGAWIEYIKTHPVP